MYDIILTCIHVHILHTLFAESDFERIAGQDIVFTVGGEDRMCFNVTIIDDEALENTETLHVVTLLTNDTAIIFESNVLTLGIENDDRKLIGYIKIEGL